MKKTYKQFKQTEMTKMFDQLNIFFYVCGYKDFWISDMNLSKKLVQIYDKALLLATILITIMMFSNFATVFTQNNLTPQQSTDLILLGITTPVILQNYCTFLYYKAEVRDILYYLVVVIKEHYYEKEAELQLIKKLKMYMAAFTFGWFYAQIERAVRSLLGVILHDGVFSPYVTAWPDVNESSSAGLAVRLAYYISTWCYGFRLDGTYGMILILLLTLSYQFKELQNYFYHLELIFEDSDLSQEEKEKMYEERFKSGIYIHVLSLWCVRQCQNVCSMIYSGQLFFTIGALIFLLRPLLVSEGVSAKLPYIPLFVGTLTVAALLMWNSGNITYEAQCVSHAIYASGWQNCHGMSSQRVRKLVVNAMLQAQQPVVLRGFGIVDLSYENWIKILKTSYSVFSVLH